MKKKVLLLAVLSALSSSVVVQAASAPDTTYDLGNVVVTASRMAEKTVEVPADTTVITEKQLEDGNYATVGDALQAHNVPVVKKEFGSYVELNGDTRVLVMVNGRRINWDHLVVSGAGNAVNIDQVPIESVARIEVVKGPNSSLYGERAVAGVVNIITKTPSVGQKTTIRGEVGSWGARKGTIVTQGGDESNGYLLTYSKERRDNYHYKDTQGSSHEFPDSQLDRTNWTGTLEHYFGDDRLRFDFTRSEMKDGYGIYLKKPLQGIVYGPGNKRIATDSSYGLAYDFADADGQIGDTFLRIYRNTETTSTAFGGGDTKSSYSHDLKNDVLEGQKTWRVQKHTIVSGFSISNEHIWEENNGAQLDRMAQTRAIFAEDKWDFAKNWNVNWGTRYEHHNTFGGDFASHIGLNRKLDDTSHVYVSWGQGVNNPTLKMLYANTPFWIGNPDLKQERSYTWTLGADKEFSDRLQVSASVFDSRLKNALQWVSLIKGYENVNREHRRGLTLKGTYKVDDHWTVNGGYMYLDIQQDNGTGMKAVDTNRTPNVYSLGLTYDSGRWNITNTLQYVTGRALTQFSDTSYLTWDMNVNYRINKDLKVYAQGFNLTNASYEIVPSTIIGAYAMPERHYVAGIEYTF